MITILYPASQETQDLVQKALTVGTILGRENNMETREIYIKKSRAEIHDFERWLEERQISHDMIVYSEGIQIPKVKKFRPHQSLHKEVHCALYQYNEVEEMAMVDVASLLSLVESDQSVTLKDSILAFIHQHSFLFDNVDAIDSL